MVFTDRIIFTGKIDPELFDGIADKTAKFIATPVDEKKDGQKNKSTQLRKYYDELSMWEQKIKQNPEKYSEFLPLIKMINAKVAYANGRKLVDDNFLILMRHCLSQLTEDKKTFENCKLFFEAFMGFYKVYKPL
jgi:CRISPR-associated protein Csm2